MWSYVGQLGKERDDKYADYKLFLKKGSVESTKERKGENGCYKS